MSSDKSAAGNPYARPKEAIREPPQGFLPTLRYLGPSFILIGSIVGSGELILTTSFGALVGFTGLWFILLSCVCKTVIQSELGRYTISSGDTCLEAFNRLPGPRWRVSWFVWLWILWQIPNLVNSGGILGSAGQALAVAFPVLEQQQWAMLLAVVNVFILLYGRYDFLERTSLVMVISFSVITVAGAIALQFRQQAVPVEEALGGLVVQLGPLLAPAVLATTVSAFAATGVSGGELMSYTYWCVEKGYARYTGEADQSEDWVRRARGWIKVMQTDVWLATFVFTSTTLAFFWLGAGVLKPAGMKVGDSQMITTLQHIYTQTLGPWAAALFLVGAFFVLYSTIFSGTAGSSRMYADVLCVMKVVDFSDFSSRMRWIRIFTVIVPLIQAGIFAFHVKPASMILFGAVSNGLLIPLIAIGTIWLRLHGTDRRITPGKLTDVALLACTAIIAAVSATYLWLQGPNLLNLLNGGGR